MDVFERVKMLCEQRGISMAEMERGAGLGERSTYNWKRVTPSWDTLEKVADYFNVSIDYLMGRETPQLQAAAAHFDVDKLTDEGREMLESYYSYLAERFAKD